MGSDDSKVSDNDLRLVPTTYTISPEQFERLYLSPKGNTQGNLRQTLGNPTPIAVMGFIMALTPISIALMGWRGSGGNGVATVGATLWFGGVLLLVSGLLEFILGNSFPSIVFFGYGAHFLTFGFTFIPFYDAVAPFTATGTSQMLTPGFLASYAFYNVFMAVLSLVFLICSIRTNLIFLLVFVGATLGFCLISAGFWMLSVGNTAMGETLVVATGGTFFATCMFGWYLLLALMLGIMDLPTLPVFDLSTRVPGVSQRRQKVRTDEES